MDDQYLSDSAEDVRSSFDSTETEDNADGERKDEAINPKIHRVRSESFTVSSSEHECDMSLPVVLPANLRDRLYNNDKLRRKIVTQEDLKDKLVAAEQRRTESIQQIVDYAKTKQERCNKVAEELDLRAKKTLKILARKQEAAERKRSQNIQQIIHTARSKQERFNAASGDDSEDRSNQIRKQLEEKQAAAEKRRKKNLQKRADSARVCQERCQRIAAAFGMMCSQQAAKESCSDAPYSNDEVRGMLNVIQSDINAVLGRMEDEIVMAEETLQLLIKHSADHTDASSSSYAPGICGFGGWNLSYGFNPSAYQTGGGCESILNYPTHQQQQSDNENIEEMDYSLDHRQSSCAMLVGNVDQPDLPKRLRSRLQSYSPARHRITQADLQTKLEAAEKRREKFIQKRRLSNSRSNNRLSETDYGEEKSHNIESAVLADLFQVIKDDVSRALKNGETRLDLKWRLHSERQQEGSSNFLGGSSISIQINGPNDIKIVKNIRNYKPEDRNL